MISLFEEKSSSLWGDGQEAHKTQQGPLLKAHDYQNAGPMTGPPPDPATLSTVGPTPSVVL